MSAPSDTQWMTRALRLARRGEGHTRPNPPVGAVVVRGGRLLGEGYHRRAGCPHAEVEALQPCLARAHGATLYVTLEPCSTTGRTPPCTDLILRSGVARVVVGCTDPNPRHAGRGLELLRRAGVRVDVGVCEAECRALIEPFVSRICRGRPYLTLKLASTLDGRIADRNGRSQWITGPAARAWVQRLRRRADAILVGAETVRADNPELHCRLRGAGEPWRVIVAGAGRLPANARVLHDAHAARTILATTAAGARALRRRLPAESEARLWIFPARRNGQLPLRALLRRLAREAGVMHVVCEGGGRLAGALARERLVDTYAWLVAPALLGDAAARPSLAGLDRLLPRRLELRFTQVRRLGPDLLLMARGAGS